MTGYKLSTNSRNSLKDVHPDLIAVTLLALYAYTDIDFMVIEGARSMARQKQLVSEEKSQTMDSYHLLQKDGLAHAIDLAPWIEGDIPWDDWSAFERISKAMKKAADKLGVRIEWGGDWESFKDGPHYQLA